MIGQTISHYRILEKVGVGGMSVVYKAEDTTLKRHVALKFPSAQVLADEAKKARFTLEARAAAALDHANICTLHEIDESEGKTFISMAYVDGQSLYEKIESGPLSLDEAVDISIQAAQGLYEAHEKGIVHQKVQTSWSRTAAR
ncbi:MAG: serine/threonine protein kinase [Planctomycetota bacterium]|jgi:serine/threonine protein kinase